MSGMAPLGEGVGVERLPPRSIVTLQLIAKDQERLKSMQMDLSCLSQGYSIYIWLFQGEENKSERGEIKPQLLPTCHGPGETSLHSRLQSPQPDCKLVHSTILIWKVERALSHWSFAPSDRLSLYSTLTLGHGRLGRRKLGGFDK